jgi:hypothetical protein
MLGTVSPPTLNDSFLSESARRIRGIEKIEPVTFADLKIRTKDKRLVTFQPNEVQIHYLDLLTETYGSSCGFDWRNGIYTLRGVREDCLKFRQPGISTLWLALYFMDTINNPLTESHVYAHDGVTTLKLFQVVHRFYANLSPEKKRPTKYFSKNSVVFSDTESGIYVGMVGGGSLGRGGTVNNAHLSERAWNENYLELEVGLLQSIPSDGNITRETTANGFNEYQIERQEEHAKPRRSIFIPRFFAWNEHKEYSSPAPSDFTPDEKEQQLIESYGLTHDQLQWRRIKMSEPGMKDKFTQEYPLTEREAFLSSGNPIFDRSILERMEGRLEGVQPVLSPSLWYRDSSGAKVLFNRLRAVFAAGELTVFEEPQEKVFYLVTADPSSGLQKEKTDLDFCSASVWAFSQFRPLEQVAHLYGRWEPNEFAWLCAELAYWYYEAMLCPLRLNHGESMWNTLVHQVHYKQNRGNGWGGLYYHDPTDINEKVEPVKPDNRLPGFPEGAGGKGFAVGQAQELISEEVVILNSRITVTQCFQYVYLPGGKMGGEAGHDDAVSDFYCGAAVYKLRGHKARLSQMRGRNEASEEWTPAEAGWNTGRRRG